MVRARDIVRDTARLTGSVLGRGVINSECPSISPQPAGSIGRGKRLETVETLDTKCSAQPLKH
jgi:hypothetical protein